MGGLEIRLNELQDDDHQKKHQNLMCIHVDILQRGTSTHMSSSTNFENAEVFELTLTVTSLPLQTTRPDRCGQGKEKTDLEQTARDAQW
jgi:hypothetical protein